MKRDPYTNCGPILMNRGYRMWECGCSLWRKLGCGRLCEGHEYHETYVTHSLDGQGETFSWFKWGANVRQIRSCRLK